MSKTIDERVLQMEFDNKRFEQGAKESIATLDRLNKSCQLDGASEGFANLEKAIDNINNHFTIMGRLTERVMDRIVDKIESTASSIARLSKSLSVDQIGAGFSKYESITASTQTIMGALSESDKKKIAKQGISEIDYVTEQLKRMNQYTDETSYNLTDMTSNVGKFMSAGVDLQSAVSAMEGIANWAARSGANVNEASRAMYNLSQAMGVGYMQLMDWKSIENANMATKEFKEQIIATAKAMGTLDEEGNTLVKNSQHVTAESFNQTLSDKWLTSDVLMKTLNDYNDFYNKLVKIQDTKEGAGMTITDIIGELQDGTEQGSKWIKEFNIDLDSLSAKSFLAAQEYKSFSDVISATQDAVSTSWMNIFQDIFGNLEESKDLWSRVGDDFSSIFVDPIANLQTLLDKWKELGGRDNLLAAFDNLREAINSIVGPFTKGFGDIFGFFDDKQTYWSVKLVQMTDKLKKFTASLVQNEDAQNGIRTVARQLARTVQLLGGAFVDIVGTGNAVLKFLYDVGSGMAGFVGNLEQGIVSYKSFEKASKSFDAIIRRAEQGLSVFWKRLKKFPIIGDVARWIEQLAKDVKGQLVTSIDWAIAKFEELTGIKLNFKLPTITANDLTDALDKLFNAAQHVYDVFASHVDWSTPVKFFKSIWEAVKQLGGELNNWINGKYTEFMSKDGPIQSLITAITGFDPKSQLDKAGDSIKKFGSDVHDTLFGIDWKLVGEVGLIGAITAFIITFKKQIEKLMGLGKDFKETLLGTFSDTMKSISSAMNAAATSMKADALVKCAEAIAILAVSVVALASVDADALARCTVSLLALMYGLSKLMNAKTNREMGKAAKSFSGIGNAIRALAYIISNAVKRVALGVMLVGLAASMATLVGALMMFKLVDLPSMFKAGAALVALGLAVTGFVAVLNRCKNVKASQLVGLSWILNSLPISLLSFATVAKKISAAEVDIGKVNVFLGSITNWFMALMGITTLANKITDGHAFDKLSRTILSLSAAIVILGAVPEASTKGIRTISTAISQFAGALIVLVGAAAVVKIAKLSKVIAKLNGSMKFLVGLTTALATFNISFSLAMAILSLFPDGIVKVAKAINKNAGVIAGAIVKVLQLALAGILAYKAKFAASVVLTLSAIVEAMGDNSENLIDGVLKIAGDVITALGVFIEKAAGYVIPAVVGVINTIARSINQNRTPILNAVGNLWNAVVDLIAEGISKLSGLDLGFTKKLVDFSGKAGLIAVGINQISKSIKNLGGATKTVNKVKSSIAGMFKSITSTPATISANVKAIAEGFTKFREVVFDAGSSVMDLGAALAGKGGLIAHFGKLVTSVGTGIASFGLFLPAILGVTAAIGGLVVAMKLQEDAHKNAIKKKYGLSDAMKESISNSEALREQWDAEQVSLAENTKTVTDKYQAYVDLGAEYDSISDKSSDAATSIKENLMGALSLNSDQVDKLIEKYGSLAEGIRMYNALVEAQELRDTLKENLDKEKKSYEDNLQTYADAQENYFKKQKQLEDKNTAYKKATNEKAKKDYIETMKVAYNYSDEEAKKSWTSYTEYLTKQYNEEVGVIEKSMGDLYAGMNDAKMATAAYETHKQMLSDLDRIIDEYYEKSDDATRKKLLDFVDFVKSMSDKVVFAGTTTSEELKKQADSFGEAFSKAVDLKSHGAMPEDAFKDVKEGLKIALQQLGASAATWLTEAIQNARDAGNTELANALLEVQNEMNETDVDPNTGAKTGEKIAEAFSNNVSNAINENSGNISDDVANMIGQQLGVENLSGLLEEKGLGNNVLSSIVESMSSGDLDVSSLTNILDGILGKAVDNVGGVSSDKIQGLIKTPLDDAYTYINGYSFSGASETAAGTIGAGIQIGGASAPTIAAGIGQAAKRASAFNASSEGAGSMRLFGNGMASMSGVINSTASSVANNAKSGLDVDTTSSGTNFVQGFLNGIGNMISAAYDAVSSFGKKLISKFNSSLGEHSPSKLTYKSGVFFIKGFTNAINRTASAATNAVGNLATDAVNLFSDSLDRISAFVNDSTDITPVITPVLDLSQVQNGSTAISSMFNSGYTMRAAASVAGSFTPPSQVQSDRLNSAMSSALKNLIEAQQVEENPTYTFNIPLEVNGRQIAKATRSYNRTELDNLNTILDRKAGIK